jgi:hypothetical protein
MFSNFKRNVLTAAVGTALLGSAHGFVVNEEFSGNYFEPGEGGRGVIIDITPFSSQEFGAGVSVQWFTYRDGQPIWLLGQGDVDQNTNTATFDFWEFSGTGGAFGPENEEPTTLPVWGTGTLRFNSCNSLTLSFDGTDGTGSQELIPSTRGEDCIIDEAFSSCPAFSDGEGAIDGTCIISGDLDESVTLTNDTTWLIEGQVRVNDGAALTIEAGTEIVGGAFGIDNLVVNQGGKIYAEGTANNPIIMRGVSAAGRGEWGGLVINGRAPLNVPGGTAVGEGDTGTYGGADPNDNSGVLRYVVVSNAGFQFTEEDEFNGIALQGVGSGTTVENIQVHLNADDGVEFFGGTVNAKNIVVTGAGDDSIDWTEGWQGNVQYVVVKQYTDEGDQGIEGDNNGDNNDLEPRALPTLANMTFIGQSTTDIGWLIREGSGVAISNSIVTGFGEDCVDIDQLSTFDNSANLSFTNNIIGTCGAPFADAETNDGDFNDPFLVSDFILDTGNNVQEDPMLSNYLPTGVAPIVGSVPYTNGFFDNVDYAGAILDANSDWTKGWTVGLDRDAPLGQ